MCLFIRLFKVVIWPFCVCWSKTRIVRSEIAGNRRCAAFFIQLGFSCLVSISLSAQYEAVLHKPYNEKLAWIDSTYRKVTGIRNQKQARQIAREIAAFGKNNNDRELELEGELLEAYYLYSTDPKKGEAVVGLLKDIARKGKEARKISIEARAVKVLSDFYWNDLKDYETGFEFLLQVDQLLESTTAREFPNSTRYYYDIGEAHYFFKDYEAAARYLKKALQFPADSFNWTSVWAATNTLGLYFQKQNRLDSSDYYFEKALLSPFVKPGQIYHSIIQGNLGYNHYLRNNFDQALPLIKADYDKAIEVGDWGLAAGAAIPIADIYLQKRRFNEAFDWIKSARKLVAASGQDHRLTLLYPVIRKWHQQMGNLQLAESYLDSTLTAKEAENNKFNALLLLRAQQRVDHLKILGEREKVVLSEKLRKTQLVALLATFLCIAGGAYALFRHQRRRYREKQKLHRELLQHTADALRDARTQLVNLAADIAEKNRLIEELENTGAPVPLETLTALRESVILTDEDWISFQKAFETGNPGYLYRLKEKVPGITPAEIRLLTLSKLHLSHKEMASALGVSSQSTRVTWHRLRKKLNLPEDIGLEDFAAGI